MRPLKTLFFSLLVFVFLTSNSIFAQDNKNIGRRSRDIEVDYDEARADAMRVSITKKVYEPVLVTQEFETGDEVRIAFQSNFDGLVYILNVTPNGKTLLLFPDPRNRDNAVLARQQVKLDLKFTSDKGSEFLHVYMSRQRIPLFDDLLKAAVENGVSKVYLDESAANAAKQLAGSSSRDTSKPGVENKQSVSAPLQNGRSGSRARGVHYDSGEDNIRKEATVAVEKEGGDGYLKLGEIAFYEIRLKHK